MKKLMVSVLLLSLSGQLYAKDFSASGSEPFWDLTLTPMNDDHCQAMLSLPGDYASPRRIKVIVRKIPHKDYVMYHGNDVNGRKFSVMTIEKPCTDEGKGDTWSHVVKVEWDDGCMDGCGGSVIKDSDGSDIDSHAYDQAVPVVNSGLEKAKRLNTQGYRLYQKGEYCNALIHFFRATEADPSYVLGQYNLACTASLVLEKFECLQNEKILEIVQPDIIFSALKQAIQLDPKRLERIQTDPDLALVRKSYRYYRDILHYSFNNEPELQKMLVNIEWQQSANGDSLHGEMSSLVFNNRFVTVTGNNGKKTGSYTLDNGLITLIFTSEEYGTQQISGRLFDNNGVVDGVLRFTGAEKAQILPADVYRSIFPPSRSMN